MGITVGIDLGTTNTAFSFVENGTPKMIPNKDGYNLTPSVLGFRNDDLLIGRAAKRQMQLHPEHTIHSSKRFIGRRFKDVKQDLHLVGYKVVPNEQGESIIIIDDDEYLPQEVAATIIRHIKRQAEEYLQEEISEAVITVPAYFDDRMRQATKTAGLLAGLDVLRVINEPTAAALAYASKVLGRKKIAVYDFGGGTFDISILEMENNLAHVLSTRGDNSLGGNDIDGLLTKRILQDFQTEHDIDLSEDPISLQRIRDEAERVKCELSTTNSSTIYLPFIYNNPQTGPINLQQNFTREEFEELIQELIESTMRQCQLAIDDAHLKPIDIDEVILVGGSSRIPLVQHLLKDIFPGRMNRSLNPDEVVALGAGIQADMLTGENAQSIVLLDVTPFSLGIEVEGGKYEPLIHRNSAIPIEVRRQATTVVDNQRTIKIHILQGEEDEASKNTSLGQFELTNISPAPKNIPKIEIRISINNDGIVKVSATDTRSGRKEQIQIEKKDMMSSEEISRTKNKLEAFEVNSPDTLKVMIQGQLEELNSLSIKHQDLITDKFRRNITELEKRTKAVLDKTENMKVLRKLLSSVHVIQNDLEDHVRPNLK
jgi:molecular chaperone DnaK